MHYDIMANLVWSLFRGYQSKFGKCLLLIGIEQYLSGADPACCADVFLHPRQIGEKNNVC